MSNTPQTHRDDLLWLFQTCESEMGCRSNFTSFIAASKIGASRSRVDGDTGDLTNGAHEDLDNEDRLIDQIDEKRAMSRMGATRRNRKVMAAYSKMHPMHQRILEGAYTPRQYSEVVTKAFGHLAGLAPLTNAARGIPNFTAEWLAHAVVRKDSRVAAIKTQALRMLQEAHAAYERACQATPEPPVEPSPSAVEEPAQSQPKAKKKPTAREATP